VNKEIELAMSVNSITWACQKRLQLRDGITFTIKDMPYLVDLINPAKKIMNVKKGAQVCLTTTMFIDDIHACYHKKFQQGIMYMMPSVKSVEKLCKVSFDPIFDLNVFIKKRTTCSNATIKTISSRSIGFVGAQPKTVGGSSVKDSDNLRSFPCDRVDRDEVDIMDQDMVYMSKQRLKRSLWKQERNFGSPTYPDYGIDAMYENSDQGKWQIECQSCGKYTCLPETFPQCILLVGGRWRRSCTHCQAEIFVADGSWEHEYPDRREAGYWVDGLLSSYANLDDYMYDYNHATDKQRSEFVRSTLGIATTEAENQLTEQDVLDRCTNQPIDMFSYGETVMGVDVGKTLHVVIGIRTGRDTYDICNVSRVDSFGDLHLLAQKMNVRFCVIDAMPEDHKTKEFAKEEPYAVYRAYCSEHYAAGRPNWDSKQGTVKSNRNEWMDKVHEVVVSKKIRIPRSCPETQLYSVSMTKTAKSVIEHPETGVRKPRWLKLIGSPGDHYYLSTLYFLLAASRVSPRRRDGQVERHTKQKTSFSMGR